MASFVGATGSWAAFTYLGAFLARRHGFSTSEVGLGYLAIGVGMVAGTRMVGSRLGARPGPLLVHARVAGGVLLGASLLLPRPARAGLRRSWSHRAGRPVLGRGAKGEKYRR